MEDEVTEKILDLYGSFVRNIWGSPHRIQEFKKILDRNSTPPEALARILDRKNPDKIAWYVAKSLRTPPEALAKCVREGINSRSNESTTPYYAARNPNLPVEVLVEMLQTDEFSIVRTGIAQNPNVPVEIIVDMLSRNKKDNVYHHLAYNKSTPFRVRMAWLDGTDQMDEEEVEPVSEVDNSDLENFEGLLSSNVFNLKKHAIDKMDFKYYDPDVAHDKNTDPEVLSEMVNRNIMFNNDVIQEAAGNPSTPVESLARIVDLLWDVGDPSEHWAILKAVNNPSCSTDILGKILSSEEMDYHINDEPYPIGFHALRHKNSIPEFFKAVIDDDIMSETAIYASQMSGCPIRSKVKYIEEMTPKRDTPPEETIDQDDSDLDEFEGLLSSNVFNLKKQSSNEIDKQILEKYYKYDMDSDVREDLLGRLDVVSLLKYKNSTSEVFEKLLDTGDSNAVTWVIAKHHKTPVGALERCVERGFAGTDKDTHTSFWAARNPKLPPEFLMSKLRDTKFHIVRTGIAQNANLPVDFIRKMLDRHIDDLTYRDLANNVNTPLRDKVAWMKGIGEYDKRWNGEVDEIEEPYNEDLDEFEGLLSSNVFNLKKHAINYHFPNWYNRETAENPSTHQKILERIHNYPSEPETLVPSRIAKELSQAVASNPNTSPELLSEMTIGPEGISSMAENAIKNPSCPPKTLSFILKNGDTLSKRLYAATNPKCPPEALANMLLSPFQLMGTNVSLGVVTTVMMAIAENPNTPVEALVQFLRTSDNRRVARVVLHRDDIPLRERIKFAEKMGGTDEVGNVENEVPDNTDLDEFENLIGHSGFRLKKIAILESWYTVEVAKDPNVDPERLYRIISKMGDDSVTNAAYENPRCPVEILVETFERGTRNQHRVEPYNRHFSDNVLSAVCNPSMPPHVMSGWLQRGDNDGLSKMIVDHGNISDRDKLMWMESVGRLPDSGQAETVEQDNSDLDEFENLFSSSGFKLRKVANDELYSIEVALDSSTSSEVLDWILSKGNEDSVSTYTIMHPNVSLDLLEEIVLSRGDDQIARAGLSNINCPISLLTKIIRRGDDDLLASTAIKHPKIPTELLEEVLDREIEDRISWGAYRHKNTPDGAKLRWKLAITPENDPEPQENVNNDDLDEFEGLFSSNVFNLKKHAGDWDDFNKYDADSEWMQTVYNSQMAESSLTSPFTLAKILMQYRYDGVSSLAAKNPRTPPEALGKFIRNFDREWNSSGKWAVTQAAKNPNVPPEVLAEVLLSGWDDNLSQYAASNSSTPPEALAEVMKIKEDKDYLYYVALNPNTPTESLAEMVSSFNYLSGDYITDRHVLAALRNPNVPAEALAEVLEGYGTSPVMDAAARHNNTPSDVLSKILRQGVHNSVSEEAARNVNAPLRDRITWLRLFDMMSDDDTESIEDSGDTDLDEFEGLLSSNKFNLKKHSEDVSSWFNEETASNPDTDPYVMFEIIKMGRKKGDWDVSAEALKNPNLPTVALTYYLVTWKKNLWWLNQLAVIHPNVDREIIDKMIKDKEWLGGYALRNPMFSTEELKEKFMSIYEKPFFEKKLKGFEDKDILESISLNPNFPLDLLIKVFQDEDISNNLFEVIAENERIPKEIMMEEFRKSAADKYKSKARMLVNSDKVPEALFDEVLSRGIEDHLSQAIVRHEKASARARLLWMQATGKEDIPETMNDMSTEDEDLDEFEGLFSKRTFNLKKHADELPTFYDIKEDDNIPPEKLMRVIVERPDKPIAGAVLYHPNCPSEAYEYAIKNYASITYIRNASRSPKVTADFIMEAINNPDMLKISRSYSLETSEILGWMARNKNLTPDYIRENFDRFKDEHHGYIKLGFLVNENTPLDLIMDTYNEAQSKLSNPDTYDWQEVRMLGNIVQNPNVPTDILIKALWSGKEYVSSLAASNINLPKEEFVKIFNRSGFDQLMVSALENKNAPIDVLQEVVVNGSEELQGRVVSWYKCNPDVLAAKLALGLDDHVSMTAYHHPNARPKDKLLWVAKTQKEEPEEIEEQDNNDLEEFEGLLSNNTFNLKKNAANAPWLANASLLVKVNDENVSPDILKEVIMGMPKKDKNSFDGTNRLIWDGNIVFGAVKNPNCPPEALDYVLRKRNRGRTACIAALHRNAPARALMNAVSNSPDSPVAVRAASNSNMLPEMLSHLMTGAIGGLMIVAARNPSTPVEDLVSVLEKNKTDAFSKAVAENPSVPPRAKINWLIGTGKIQNEKSVGEESDSSLTNIDTDYITDDLDEFEGLLK